MSRAVASTSGPLMARPTACSASGLSSTRSTARSVYAGRHHGIDDGHRGAAGEVAGGRQCAAFQTLSGHDGLCDRP